jgi:hypothetical protein
VDEGEACLICFARHHGPDEGSLMMRAAIRGGNWNNGANCSLACLNLNNAPSNTNTNIGFRGIPFADGMCDHGCARNIRSTVHHPEYPSLDVAEYKTGSGETVGDIRDLPAQLIRLA